MGRSASSNRMSANRCSMPRATPTAEMNSETTTSAPNRRRSEEHTSELQSQSNLVCRLLLEKKKTKRSNSLNVITHHYPLPNTRSSPLQCTSEQSQSPRLLCYTSAACAVSQPNDTY